MKNRRIICLILTMLLLVMTVAPSVSFAATTTVTIKIMSDGEPDDEGGKGWDIGYGDYGDYDELGIVLDEGYTFKFSGSTCKMPVYNSGTISSGTFSDYVINFEDGKLSGGTYSGTVINEGEISGGTYSGSKIYNYGTVSGGTFKKLVKNEGKITGGSFKGATNEEKGTISGGSFDSSVTNYGEIPKKNNKATFNGGFINLGVVAGGSFKGTFVNGDSTDDDYEDSEVKGGTFSGGSSDEFDNYAVISGGTFDMDVTNYNTIKGGTFNKTVILEDSKHYDLEVSGGHFTDIENNSRTYDLDDAELSFAVKTSIKGTGNVSAPSSAESGDKVTVLTAPGIGVELDSIKVYDASGDKVTVKKQSDNYYTFTMPTSSATISVIFDDYDEDNEIETVAVYVEEPVEGEDLANATNVEKSGDKAPHYKVSKTVWYLDGDVYDDEAEEGDEYTIYVTVVPNSGYFFSDDSVHVTINGYKCKVDSLSTNKLVAYYTFDEVEHNNHKHKYEGKYNSTYHWKECSCGSVIEKEKHTFGSNGYCTVCGAYDATKVTEMPFKDVAKNAYYYDAVNWAYTSKPQVTEGTSATTFGPGSFCTRGQVMTFLWRAKGQPEPKSTNNPFTDVKSTDYYYKAVLWAYQNKITDGTSATKFSPNSNCTNAQIITFIWRAMGEPEKDANAQSWWTDAYYWAKYNNLLKGSYTGTYKLDDNCTRANTVFYLYNYSKLQK